LLARNIQNVFNLKVIQILHSGFCLTFLSLNYKVFLPVYFDNLCSEKLHSPIAGQSAPKLAINELNTALKTATLQTLG